MRLRKQVANSLADILLSGLAIVWLLNLSTSPIWADDGAPPTKRVAITVDDLPLNGPSLNLAALAAMNRNLTRRIQAKHIPAIGFVNENKLFAKTGEVDARIALLQMWLDSGCELGNHTFSHPNLESTPLDAFEDDVIKGGVVTAKLLESKNKKLEYFRYPYLETGPDAEKKHAFQQFLSSRHYTNAPVTIDAGDWLFSAVYTKAKLRGDKETMLRVSSAYLSFTQTMFDYYEKMALAVVGHPIAQILLLHCNSLNADHFDELVKLMQDAHYDFISLGEALQDPAYKLPEKYVGNEGVSWLKRWRFSQGKQLNEGSEPEIPQFVQDLYKDAHYAD